MKKKQWKPGGNAMVVESGHKTFDSQTNCISVGNVISNTQVSRYIRDYHANYPFGDPALPGQMQKFDLDGLDPPRFIRTAVEKHAIHKSVILYKFRHFSKNREIVDGWVITDVDYHLLNTFVTGPTYKSYDVIYEAISYVTAEGE